MAGIAIGEEYLYVKKFLPGVKTNAAKKKALINAMPCAGSPEAVFLS